MIAIVLAASLFSWADARPSDKIALNPAVMSVARKWAFRRFKTRPSAPPPTTSRQRTLALR